jgi:hypothetical protein
MKPLRVVILQDVGSFTSSLDWDGILDAPASEINQPNHLLLPNWQVQNCILQTVNQVLDMPIHLTRVLPNGVHNQESLPLLVQKVCSIHFPCLMFLGYISLKNQSGQNMKTDKEFIM